MHNLDFNFLLVKDIKFIVWSKMEFSPYKFAGLIDLLLDFDFFFSLSFSLLNRIYANTP